MNSSSLIHFIRSHPAMFVAAGLIAIFVFGMASALRPRKSNSTAPLYSNSPPGEIISHKRDPSPVITTGHKTAPAPARTNKPFSELHIHSKSLVDTNAPPLRVYAPAGRLLRCQLVNTIDSANIDTPIIALLTEDLWHDGHLVIPAGTEVHGKASVDRLRERVVASGAWTIVWQSGEELVVNGIALDREENAPGTWGITDGSAGLVGQVLRSDSLADIKLFIATFISGVASGLQETRSTVFGSQVTSTTRNASLAGASQVMNSYAQQILETIKREGIYVRVPAGKQMYLYVPHTIDLSQAKAGNLRVSAIPAAFSQNLNSVTKPSK